MIRRGSAFWGSLIFLLGVLMLLDTLDIIPGFNMLVVLGPILLIATGVWVLWGGSFGRGAAERVNIPLEGASRARVRLGHGAGRLSLTAGGASESLVEGEFGGGLDLKTERHGDTLDVSLVMPRRSFPLMLPGNSLDWSVRLNPRVPFDLDLAVGAGDYRIDLSQLNINALRLQTGASSTNITLPEAAGNTSVRVEAGVASVTLRVPVGVAARIHVESGLAGINIDENRFPKVGGVYQSPDFGTAANRVDLNIQTGVGSIMVL